MNDLPTFPSYAGDFITPYLAVGPWPKPEHAAELADAGIRGIVNVVAHAERKAFAYLHHLPESVHWTHVGFWDGYLSIGESVGETLTPGYARVVVQRAAMVLRDHSPVLVHCMGGQGRSGNIAAILLAAREQISVDEAIRIIRARRPSIATFFHDGFWRHAPAGPLVELAATVLAEPDTPDAVFCDRVRGAVDAAADR